MSHSAPPRITIALVTFNAIGNIFDLVGGLRALTRQPYDLLIVDNASTDGTLAYLRRLKLQGDKAFRLIENESNVRCARATNQAIALCRTEFLIYLCSTHALVTEPGWDERVTRFMDAHPEFGIAGDVWNPYSFDTPSARYHADWTPDKHGRERLLHVQGGAWIARKAVFEEFGGFADDDYPHAGMDVEFSYRLLSHGRRLGACPAIASPRWPEAPALREGIAVYHPASDEIRRAVRRRVPHALERAVAPQKRAAALVFCERIDNESYCESVIRELRAYYDVRPYGPGWPARTLDQVDRTNARFFLHLDSASGRFDREEELARLQLPKFAWLVDVHKKPAFHQSIAREMDFTFHAMKTWGHAIEGPTAWLPLHCDTEIFRPVTAPPAYDVVFVGSQPWRADPIRRIGLRHGLKVHIASTTGPREKSETAAIYAKARLVFNRHVTNDLNFRVFEAMACGRVLLTDAQWNGQYDLFQDGKHYVLYKDERDLEQQILRLLGDDAARGRIEAAAAAFAAHAHSTRARVQELHDAVESFLATRPPPAPPGPPPRQALPAEPVTPAQHSTARRRRWLLFVEKPPATVEQRSYAERLGWGLAERGHGVVVARKRCRNREARPPQPDRPSVLELDTGPLPAGPTDVSVDLAAAGPLHRALDRVLREHGPFDVVVGEGAVGGLVAQPLAARRGLPFLLALSDCEVRRRGNRLTREQLYWAEVEHWAVEHARRVLVPHLGPADALAHHYGCKRTTIVQPRCHVQRPRKLAELRPFLCALGLASRPYQIVLAPALGVDERSPLLRGGAGDLVIAAKELWLRRDGDVVRAGRRPAAGAPLAALIAGAASVLCLDESHPGVLEAVLLNDRVQIGRVDGAELRVTGPARFAPESLDLLVSLALDPVAVDSETAA